MLMAAGRRVKGMKSQSIIEKIENAGLVGRGGANFPTAKKWLIVKSALRRVSGGYIVVNAAEGEPGVKKDAFLLKNEAPTVIDGINLAYNFLGKNKIKTVYFYINRKYYNLYSKSLFAVLKSEKKYLFLAKKIKFFIKPLSPSYIGGEESAVLNIIEGNRAEPKKRPPFPAEKGINNLPTLVNNVETLYSVSLISKNKYQGKRLYTISGAVKYKGVYSLPADASAEDILRATDNYPDFDFFAILGGEVCGEVLDKNQLLAPIEGSGFIMVFNKEKTDKDKLLNYWLKYYETESCGLCTPCREGSYRLREMLKKGEINKKKFIDLLDNLEQASFCSLGSSLSQTVKSYLENIYKQK
jgi:NADH:ubiquinone oxidoreductase subunit F (NADH-binding)